MNPNVISTNKRPRSDNSYETKTLNTRGKGLFRPQSPELQNILDHLHDLNHQTFAPELDENEKQQIHNLFLLLLPNRFEISAESLTKHINEHHNPALVAIIKDIIKLPEITRDYVDFIMISDKLSIDTDSSKEQQITTRIVTETQQWLLGERETLPSIENKKQQDLFNQYLSLVSPLTINRPINIEDLRWLPTKNIQFGEKAQFIFDKQIFVDQISFNKFFSQNEFPIEQFSQICNEHIAKRFASAVIELLQNSQIQINESTSNNLIKIMLILTPDMILSHPQVHNILKNIATIKPLNTKGLTLPMLNTIGLLQLPVTLDPLQIYNFNGQTKINKLFQELNNQIQNSKTQDLQIFNTFNLLLTSINPHVDNDLKLLCAKIAKHLATYYQYNPMQLETTKNIFMDTDIKLYKDFMEIGIPSIFNITPKFDMSLNIIQNRNKINEWVATIIKFPTPPHILNQVIKTVQSYYGIDLNSEKSILQFIDNNNTSTHLPPILALIIKAHPTLIMHNAIGRLLFQHRKTIKTLIQGNPLVLVPNPENNIWQDLLNRISDDELVQLRQNNIIGFNQKLIQQSNAGANNFFGPLFTNDRHHETLIYSLSLMPVNHIPQLTNYDLMRLNKALTKDYSEIEMPQLNLIAEKIITEIQNLDSHTSQYFFQTANSLINAVLIAINRNSKHVNITTRTRLNELYNKHVLKLLPQSENIPMENGVECPTQDLFDLHKDMVVISQSSKDSYLIITREYYQAFTWYKDNTVSCDTNSSEYEHFKQIKNINGQTTLMKHLDLNLNNLFKEEYPIFHGLYKETFVDSNVGGIFHAMKLPQEIADRCEELLHVSESSKKDLINQDEDLYNKLQYFMTRDESGNPHLNPGVANEFIDNILEHYKNQREPEYIKLLLAITILARLCCETFLGTSEDSPRAIRQLAGLLLAEINATYPDAPIENWNENCYVWSQRLQGNNINITDDEYEDAGLCVDLITRTITDICELSLDLIPPAWLGGILS